MVWLVFFFSGAAGLGYQIAWSRMFAHGLGHEMPSVLAVVAALFGGMAAGAWMIERFLDRGFHPGRCYGALELLIGAWGFLSIALIPSVNAAALNLTGLNPSWARQWLVAFSLPALALLPATCAMGATFPAMERFASSRFTNGRCIGALYAANTLGAVTGVVVSTWDLLPRLGFANAVKLFATVNVLCGLAVLALAGIRRTLEPSRPSETSGLRNPRLLLFASGLLGIGFEVLGVRVLANVFQNTVYTYSAVLSVYLLGTAAGAAAYQVYSRRRRPARLTSDLFLGLSVATLIGAGVLARASAIDHALGGMRVGGLRGIWWGEFATAGLVFLLPTLLMGATFSHLAQTAKAPALNMSRALVGDSALGVGRALALNTLGAALAPLFFGVILFPGIGAKWSCVLLSVAYACLALPLRRARRWLLAAPLVLILLLPRQLGGVALSPGEKLLSYREGITDSVAVVEHVDGNRTLLVNNRFTMGGTSAASAERRHASIPLLLHPNSKRALFLGLGTGITFAAAGAEPGLQADGVELVPEIVQALPWFAPFNQVPDTNRFKAYVADARRFVRVCPDHYDVIVADLFHPARDGAGALYSLEHFRAIRARLAQGGLFCQWLPLFQLDDPVLRVIVRTFLEVFPDGRAFLLRFNVETPVLGLIGGLRPERYSPQYFSERVRDPSLANYVKAEQLRDAFHLFGCLLAGPQRLANFARGAAFNTDDRPVVLFDAPRFNPDGKTRSYAELLRLLQIFPPDARELAGSDADAGASGEFLAQLQSFMAARDAYLKGLVAEAEVHRAEAIDWYLESARLSPLFPSGYAQCIALALQQTKADPAGTRKLLERLIAAQPERPAAAELLKRLFPNESNAAPKE